MSKLGIDPVIQDKIKIEVLDVGDDVALTFSGDIDMEDPSVILDPTF
jgi:hypothetical protein